MSISAPPGQPAISQTLGSSFRDAGRLAMTNLVPVLLFIVVGTALAYTLISSGALSNPMAANAMPPSFPGIIAVFDLLAIIVGYYAIAAAVRTVNPDYHMTLRQFLGILGYAFLAALLTMLATIALVIPGYWVGVKLLLTPFTYAVTNGAPDALKTTWNMTTGYYWQTFGMFLLEGLCVAIILYAVFFACGFAAVRMPVLTIVLGPIALAVLAWLIHVRALICVRWTLGLLPRANAPSAATAATA